MTTSTVPLSSLPLGPVLYLFSYVDSICNSFHVPQWRDSLPFGLGVGEGFLAQEFPKSTGESYFPSLPTYEYFASEHNLDPWSVSTMIQFATTPSTSLSVLTTSDALLVLCAMVLLMRTVKGIVIPLFCDFGARVGRSTHGEDWEKHNQERIIKFGEYVYRLIYHSAVSGIGLWYFWDKPWWSEEQGGSKNCYIHHPFQPVEAGMTWYYMMQCAYNVEAMLSLLELSFIAEFQNPFYANAKSGKKIQSPIKISWNPTCRGDFQEMFAHHVITNLLVFGSSHARFTRVGSMVFLVHDISDVPVDLSKLANFMKWKVTTIVCFVALMVVWAITRLGMLPFVIIKGALFDSHVMYLEGPMHVMFYRMYIPFFHFLLIGITSLHVFWFVILLRIGFRLVMKGERHDLSEHKQGEDQEGVVGSSAAVKQQASSEKKLA